MDKNSEVIITTIKQADNDATELVRYIESISTPADFREAHLPALVRNLEDEESEVSKKYVKGAKIIGGGVATTIATSVSRSLLTKKFAISGASVSMNLLTSSGIAGAALGTGMTFFQD